MTKQTQSHPPEGLLSRWARLKTRTLSDSAQPISAPDVNNHSADVDEELDPLSLRQLFQQQEFNHRDGMNEYDEEYTGFTSLGELVTQEMQRALTLTEQAKEAEIDADSAVPSDDQKLA